jgi:hypothetical protein
MALARIALALACVSIAVASANSIIDGEEIYDRYKVAVFKVTATGTLRCSSRGRLRAAADVTVGALRCAGIRSLARCGIDPLQNFRSPPALGMAEHSPRYLAWLAMKRTSRT